MKAFWQSFFATILAIVVVALVATGVIVSKGDSKKKIEDHSWLVVDFYGSIEEYDPPSGIIGAVGGGGETLQRILGNLEKAAIDERIEGVIFKISGSNSAGLAMLDEIRGAARKVRGAGKKVFCWSDDLNRNAMPDRIEPLHAEGSRVRILAIPNDEERAIYDEGLRLLGRLRPDE